MSDLRSSIVELVDQKTESARLAGIIAGDSLYVTSALAWAGAFDNGGRPSSGAVRATVARPAVDVLAR